MNLLNLSILFRLWIGFPGTTFLYNTLSFFFLNVERDMFGLIFHLQKKSVLNTYIHISVSLRMSWGTAHCNVYDKLYLSGLLEKPNPFVRRSHLKIEEAPRVKPWHSLFFLLRAASTNITSTWTKGSYKS